MAWELNREDFNNHEIAREDNGDGYSMSGYAVAVKDSYAIIINISHCSCYGTWDYDGNGLEGGNVFWEGSLSELLQMASDKLDPAMPSRTINSDDYDFCYLSELYKSVLKWNEKNK